MANITLSGTLLDPNSGFAARDKIRFTHKTTTGSTLKGSVSTLVIGADGAYSIDLQYGLVLVERRDSTKSQYINLGVVTVNADNPATTLPELLSASVPVSSEQLIEFQSILADCLAAQAAAEAAAAEAAAVVSQLGSNTGASLIGTSSGLTVQQSLDSSSTNSTPLVLVASGQSNMDGAGDNGYMFPENSDVKMFDLQTRAFRDVSYSNRIQRTNVNTGTTITIPGAAGKNNLAFAAAHALHEETGRTVYLIISSNGGTHIGRWVGSDVDSVAGFAGLWGSAGTAEPLYVELKNAVDDAMIILGVQKIDAFLWCQGETKRPNFNTVEDYQTDFATLSNKLKSESWWGDSTQMIAIEQVVGSFVQDAENNNPFWRSFNLNGDPNTKAISGVGLTRNAPTNLADSVHFSGDALYEIGIRCARAFLGDGAALSSDIDVNRTLYGVPNLNYVWEYTYGDTVTINPLLGRIVEQKREAPARPGGGLLAGQRIRSEKSCSATITPDGNIDVTTSGVVLQDWSFSLEDYWENGPQVSRFDAAFNASTIKGVVDKEITEKFKLWLDSGTSAAINIDYIPSQDLLANGLMTIDWGDGTVDTGLSKGLNSHTYSANYQGYVTVSLPAFCEVTSLQLTTGIWRFALNDLSKLTRMTLFKCTASGNKVFGRVSDLPDSVSTVSILGSNTVSWDVSGLPILANLELRGSAVVSSSRNGFDGIGPVKNITLGGANTTSETTDNILIDLSSVKEWLPSALIYMAYSGQGARTSASDAAVAELIAKGVNVVTN